MYFRYNATSGCVGDNVVEPDDIGNLNGCVGISSLVVLCAEIVSLPVLSGSSTCVCFRYEAICGDIGDNTIEQLDPENMDTAVGILSLCAL